MKAINNHQHSLETQSLLAKLAEWGFSKSTDTIGSFCKGNPLYYKCINEKEYLIFNHWGLKYKHQAEGFDCHLATFENEKQIGNKQPLSAKILRQGFEVKEDYMMIKGYLIQSLK